ncbi:MAG: zinc ribbon domain-containing protein [Ruminococcus sp.]|nr:zinc ribbon domain-containing protein [Ruminococcus sp.]
MEKRFCPQCGAQLLPGAMFCSQCGHRPGQGGTSYTSQTGGFYGPGTQAPANAVNTALSAVNRIKAPAARGELSLDLPSVRSAAAAVLPDPDLDLSPSGALFSGISKFFSGIANAFRSPKALICAAVMFGVWFCVNRAFARGDDSTLVRILSAATFAKGSRRPGLRAIWGTFGMGTVAAAYSSLLYGGIPKLFKGVQRVFTKGFSLGSLLCGYGFSAFCYKLFTGGISGGAAVAVCGAVLSLQAAGLESGFLHTLSAAHSKVTDGMGEVRVMTSRYTTFFAGMAAGFGASALFCRSYSYSYLLPIVILLAGRIINRLTRKKGGAVQ